MSANANKAGFGPRMTLGNMRHLGVHHLAATCLNDACRHQGLIVAPCGRSCRAARMTNSSSVVVEMALNSIPRESALMAVGRGRVYWWWSALGDADRVGDYLADDDDRGMDVSPAPDFGMIYSQWPGSG
jgi:hypothetical protein